MAAMIIGCAGLIVKPVPKKDTGEYDEETVYGFRYYQPSPYLLVYTDNQGGLVTKIIFLLDQKKKMSVRPYNWMATSQTTLEFKNGMLAGAKNVVDETVIPKAVLTSFEKAVSAAVSAAAIKPSDALVNRIPSPYLFKILEESGNYVLKGGPANDGHGQPLVINVTVAKTDDENK